MCRYEINDCVCIVNHRLHGVWKTKAVLNDLIWRKFSHKGKIIQRRRRTSGIIKQLSTKLFKTSNKKLAKNNYKEKLLLLNSEKE